jgi:iron uptake system EfeUOB component EfeO/EfeM
VDDFVADIDGRTEPIDRQLDDLDGAIDARAKSARSGY